MSEYEKDTKALVKALEAYREKYGFSFDASNHARLLLQELKMDLEEAE